MARVKNQIAYDDSRIHILDVGVKLIRNDSFKGVGINDVLREAGVPKGSFYHYFANKEAFGLDVARHYHADQMISAQSVLNDTDLDPFVCLRNFFDTAYEDYKKRGFGQGCLMCNLSSELAVENEAFHLLLQEQWNELSQLISKCIARSGQSFAGLEHLDATEAADWLLNAWSGALTRMKATRDGGPLRLFIKSIFGKGA